MEDGGVRKFIWDLYPPFTAFEPSKVIRNGMLHARSVNDVKLEFLK